MTSLHPGVHNDSTSVIIRNGHVNSIACRTPKNASDAPTFQITTKQNEKQKRALELIAQIKT
jgi:hypothetical protein